MRQSRMHWWWLVVGVAMVMMCAPAHARSEYYFTGLISTQPVQMDLVLDDSTITGSYFYDLVGTEIALKGQGEKNGEATINEFDEQGKQTGTFTGNLTADRQTYSGNWSNADGSRTLPFKLTQVAEYVSVQQSLPRVNVSGSYPRFLHASPAQQALTETMRTNVDAAMQRFLKASRANLKGIPTSIKLEADYHYAIKYYSRDLLSLVETQFAYPGGAHPSTIYVPFNMQLVDGKATPIALASLFKPGMPYISALSDYLIDALRKQNAQWVVEGQVKSFKAEDLSAFYLRPHALTFIFQQYAVGPYAQGTFFVRVPFSAVAAYLNPFGPLSRMI